jgi:hypothetical protein
MHLLTTNKGPRPKAEGLEQKMITKLFKMMLATMSLAAMPVESRDAAAVAKQLAEIELLIKSEEFKGLDGGGEAVKLTGEIANLKQSLTVQDAELKRIQKMGMTFKEGQIIDWSSAHRLEMLSIRRSFDSDEKAERFGSWFLATAPE